MRASITTCEVCVSRLRTKSSMSCRFLATSETISVFGAMVFRNSSAWREQVTDLVHQWPGLRIGHPDEARLDGQHVRDLLLPGDFRFQLLFEQGQRRHAQKVSLAHRAQALRAQNHVERLIPRHVAHLDGDFAAHVVGDDDVDLANVGQQAKNVVDVRALEIEVDAAAGVALLAEARSVRWPVAAALRASLARRRCRGGSQRMRSRRPRRALRWSALHRRRQDRAAWPGPPTGRLSTSRRIPPSFARERTITDARQTRAPALAPSGNPRRCGCHRANPIGDVLGQIHVHAHGAARGGDRGTS